MRRKDKKEKGKPLEYDLEKKTFLGKMLTLCCHMSKRIEKTCPITKFLYTPFQNQIRHGKKHELMTRVDPQPTVYAPYQI